MMEFSVPPGYRAHEAAGAAEARSVHRDHRQDPGRRQRSAEEAAAHGEADLRAAAGRARLHGRHHDREGLRRRLAAAIAGDVRAAGASAGACAGGLRRGDRRSSAAWSARSTSSRSTCRTRTPASWWPIRRRRRKRSATATCRRSHSSAACRSRSSTTTPRSRWPASSVTASVSARACSASCNRTTCSRIGSADLAKGNDKGKVEGLVGYRAAELPGADPGVRELRGAERPSAGLLPQAHGRSPARSRRRRSASGWSAIWPPCASRCRRLTTPARRWRRRVSSLSLVRYRRNDYSVPTSFGHREVIVRGYVHEVVIACGAEVIARHPRSYEREDFVFDPLHYLALIEQKINALDQAAPLAGLAAARGVRHLAPPARGAHGQTRQARVRAGAAPDGGVQDRGGDGCRARRHRARRHRLRCREASGAVPDRAPAAAPRHDDLSLSAKADGRDDLGPGLYGPAARERRHDRHAASSPGAPPQGAEAADVPARVRQGRAPVRRRGRRLSALSAAACRVGVDRSRAAHGRAPHQGGQVPDREEPRQLRLRGACRP